MQRGHSVLLLIWPSLLFGIGFVRARISEDVVAEFDNPNNRQEDMPFEKMVIDPSTGRLYVGGVNHLYDLLSLNLNVKAHAITGPEDDNVECAGRLPCSAPRRSQNANMKALAVYEKNSKLIECTNLFQGRCRWRNLYNIAEKEGIKESGQPIAANDRDSSTVIFIGSGPPDEGGSSAGALYVASTYVNNGGPFRDDVPAVAALSLDSNRLFNVASQGVGTGTDIKLERKYRGHYRIDYVGGFQSGNFAYFATRQPKGDLSNSNSWPIISKLIRVCTGDSHFWSYTEVPLECHKDGIDYNLVKDVYLSKPGYDLAESLHGSTEEDVLYAVFVRGEGGTERNAPTRESALCVYSLAEIESKFQQNIELCFRGEMTKNLPWFKSTDRCQTTRFSFAEVQCGKDVNSYIGGEMAIEAEAALVTRDAQFTAIATNTTRATTVAFIGTQDGRLLKTVIESRTSAFVYRSLEIGSGRPILQDLELDGTGEFIFALTANTVSKVKVRQCGQAGSCRSCLEQKDPYCGWCILSNGCMAESECTKSIPVNHFDWLNYRNGNCTSIRSVDPDKIQITTASFLNIELENLPNIGASLSCHFEFADGVVHKMAAEARNDGETKVRCPTPAMSRLPRIPLDADSLSAVLSVAAAGDGPPLASTNFTFYDCRRYISCSQCVSSVFPCDWCIESNQCVAGTSTENKCRTQHIINGVHREGPSRRRGSSFCPHMIAGTSDLYVASGHSRTVSVQVKNMMDMMNEFKCQFKIDHSVHERLAKRQGENIVCEEMKFEYYGTGLGNGTAIAHFSVIWSQNGQPQGYVLDNSQGIRVVMYKCESLASNCGKCLALNADKFDCGWCQPEMICSDRDRCPLIVKSDFLDRSQLCPRPVITDFHPRKGPIAGGTLVTIDGVNLGRSYADVASAVTTANVRCEVIEAEYVTSSRIICRTRESIIQKPASNPIIVKLRDDLNFTAISDQNFEYVDPAITSFEPTRGQQTGGTDLVIHGENLDAGSIAKATVAEVPCAIQRRSSKEIICRTGAAPSDAAGILKVEFDGAQKHFPNLQFKYEKDPVFQSVRPEKSIASGGITLEVRGIGFKLLQRPHMMVMDDDRAIKGPLCTVAMDELMFCQTPNLQIPSTRRVQPTIDHPLMLDYGFELDGVRTGNLSQRQGFTRLAVYPDPMVEMWPELRFFRPDDKHLTINGKYMDAAASEQDVAVTIGREQCNLTFVASRALTCQPPIERPSPRLPDSPEPEVIVTIGHRSYPIGMLSYNTNGAAISPQVVFAIAVAVVAFLLAFLLLLILYRRKSTSHQRAMKSLKNQMDTIEMKVAAECKEAFAELQTSMNQLAAELPTGTPIIPFLTYRDYAARVLFPNNYQNAAVMRDLEVDYMRAPAIENGLRQFHKLLMNKHFLLIFVRTMESSKFFLSKDRVTVGSLLMVVLQEKMDYCTEILKQLLRELITRTVERRFQPKILFRRSESVAERMLAAWFTFLMHKYLLECAGQKLYQLYWAMKQQMEKGPQDAITQEARYSLSEEKLLRSSVDFHVLTVFVAADSGNYAMPDTPVLVLDCDTITQVKEKCLDAKYRTSPYSERPSANDLDLELRSGDLDTTSRVEPGGWKRLNTLAHYKVANNAVLALLPRQASLYNLSLLSERSEKSTFSLKNSPTLTRPFGTGSSSHSKDPESGYKLYHLVRPTEHGPSEQQSEKMVSEIYLTRLLTMKGTLQRFIEELLEIIFSTSSRVFPLPVCIKYMFDFMDEQADEHGITDPEVVHAWKSNALPLRFWVNLIKNPHFVFDIQKPIKVEGCLSVVAQTLMDACSTQDHQLTKDSPSSKLLFAKDIYHYRDWVDRYYSEIRSMPAISDQDMSAFFTDESRCHNRQFFVFSALHELYVFLEQYKQQIEDELATSEVAVQHKLHIKFKHMVDAMEGHPTGNNPNGHHPTGNNPNGHHPTGNNLEHPVAPPPIAAPRFYQIPREDRV